MNYGRPPPRIDGMVSLKVDNLTYRTTPEDLRRVFERCGEVGDIYIPRDRFTRESRGFAFVRFYDKRDAEDALDAMDGRMLDGRELRVQMARYGRPTSPHRRYRGRRRSRSRSRYSRSRSRSRGRRSRSRSHTRRSVSRSRSRSDSKSSRGRSRSPSRKEEKRSKSKSNSKSRSRSRS
ncbi:serine/arginine-rich splicing factor 2 isoform X1 [Aethina tumida]|uniref:serine/arginine-rich splicing factor 2 isoform X1 n=1 Tax=Aethina tumida TaxID=116153 RepID=UPI00096B6670|nr:serine/arginine-rich splicing factor 2 isoform X1 [Aethina tumida]XP_049826349.1 serine/arginine-rich splicing factor 2 isoform X1 [Aethina tumida]XP_049826350.1 serine/arginine-rich splicing factor 2 isoform X1 [Aethina tumida]XP_049826351.1 serine/arginine-rich splicing factor 2 isoform X1 [Aethina tumida]XP_049826352.1 serine/arginine-rich splicing factor 2 isoform X1 [Aethina tumida]